MKGHATIFISFLILNACSQKTFVPAGNNFNDGLYYGTERGIISASQFYVLVGGRVAYLQCFHQLGGMVKIVLEDTLIYENDTMFKGKLTYLTFEKAGIYVNNLQDKLKWKFNIRLQIPNEKVRKEWHSNNNSIRYQAIYQRYFQVKRSDEQARRQIFRQYSALGRKIYELDQEAFLIELKKFETDYLIPNE